MIDIEKQLPWPQPVSLYDSDGPRTEAQCEPFTVAGVTMRAAPTGELGSTTLRDRYQIECVTCGEVVYTSTTSATIRVAQHLEEKHGVQRSPDKKEG